MEFAVLGPLQVAADPAAVAISGAQARTVLLRLLVAGGRTVSVDDLADSLWGDARPRTSAKSVQNLVLRLRKVLEADGEGAPRVLLTDGTGYRLDVPDEAVDARRFERLVELGRRVAQHGRTAQAAATLAEALALWRGEAYAGETCPDIVDERHRLEELRITATEDQLAADLDLGGSRSRVAELEALVRAHPLRERLWELLVVALYRSGRQADALGVYGRARAILMAELGVEPGAGLRTLQRRILGQDPGLETPVPSAGLPAELVPAPGAFVGRERELAALRRAWQRAATTPLLLVVRGAPGTGVRRLVSEFAAELADDGHEVVVDAAAASGAAPALRVCLQGRSPQPLVPGLTLLIARPTSVISPGEVIEVRPLAPDAVQELLTTYVGHDAAVTRLPDILRRSGGRPALVHDLAVQAARQRMTYRVATAATAAAEGQRALDAAREELRQGVTALGDVLDRPPAGPSDICPWKGLSYYDVEDATLFAGRERLVAELTARLVTSPLLTVVGGSGSGKSSLVRAGLVAGLRAGALPGSDAWTVLVLRPGPHPMQDLARVALQDREPTPDSVAGLLEQRVFGEDSAARTVLVVDQAEEIFTACQDAAERDAFLEVVLTLAEDRPRTSVVLVLRSDYAGDFADLPGLAPAMSDATVLIGAPSEAEMRRSIERPAARAGLVLDVGLTDALVSDAHGRPGVLPLLSTALSELWAHRDGNRLTLASYAATGGVSGAVARLAERTYRQLDVAGQTAVRILLLRLAGAGENHTIVRRRAALAELAALPDQRVRQVVGPLAESRLLTLHDHYVEVAHEALFVQWPRLRGWLDEDAAHRAVRSRLSAAAAEWDTGGRDPADVWRGARLVAADGLLASAPAEVTALEATFVQAGRMLVESERRDAERRADDALRKNRRLRRMLGVIGLLLLSALSSGAVAFQASQRAERQATVAEVRALAAASVASLGSDPELAVLLALEAVGSTRSGDGTVQPEAEEALHRAVTASRAVLTVRGIGGRVDWSPEGDLFVTEGPEESGVIDLRDARSGTSVRAFQADAVDINMARFSADGSMLASAGDDGTLRVWDLRTGHRLHALPGAGEVWSPFFGTDGRTVAAVWLGDGRPVVRVWDLSTESVVHEREMAGVKWAMALSPDARWLVAPQDDDRTPVITDVLTGRPIAELPGHDAPVLDIDISPDGRWIVTSGYDQTARVWDAATGRLVHTIAAQRGPVTAAAWAPDSRHLATAGSDGVARVWEVTASAASPLLTLSGLGTSRGLYDLTFSPDGRQLMTGDEAVTTVSVFDVTRGGEAEWATLPGNGDDEWGAAAMDVPDDVVSASGGGTVRSWDVVTGQARGDMRLIEGSGDAEPVGQVEISPDGGLVAGLGLLGGSVTVWDRSTGSVRFGIRSEGLMSGASWNADGSLLVVSNLDGTATIVDRTGRTTQTLNAPPDQTVEDAVFAPDGRSVAAIAAPRNRVNHDRRTVVFWDLESGRITGNARGLGPSNRLAFSPDGQLLAVGDEAGPAHVVDPHSGRTVRTLEGHTGQVTDVSFRPDGEQLATSSGDGSVKLWDVDTGLVVLTLYGHRSAVTSVDFSADGRRLVTAGMDDTVRVWALDIEDLHRMAEDSLTRGFTEAECRQHLHLESCADR